MQRTPALAWVMLIGLALIWGSSFILIKKGLVALSPQEVGSLRIVAASVALLPFAILRLRKVPKTKFAALASVGFLGSLIPAFLFAIAQTRLNSSITGVLNTLVPIFTIILSYFLFGQRQTRKAFLGIALGLIGTLILITSGEGGSISGINAFALLVVLATICYASNLILIKRKLDDVKALTVTSISIVMIGPFAAVFLFGFTNFGLKLSTTEGIGLAVFYISLLGVMGTSLAMIIFNKILQMTDPLFASSVTYLIPIVAVIWGLIDGERIFLIQYFGMMAVGLGVYIANRNRAQQAE